MNTPHADPFTPWLGADDLELLQNFQQPSPPSRQYRKAPYQHELHSPDSGSGDEMFTHPYPPAAVFSGSYVNLMASQQPAKAAHRSPPSTLTLKSASARHSSPTSPASPTSSTSSKSAQVNPLGAAVSLLSAEDERREKNRQKVRRHYYRKLNQLNTLRDEVAQLENQFKNLKEGGKPTTLSTTAPSTQLTKLNEAKLALEAENDQLRRLYSQKQSHISQVASLLASEHDLFFTSQLAKAHFIKPFTLQECHEQGSRAVAGVIALSAPNPMSQPFRGPSFLGWENEVSVVDGFFNFSLFKTFQGVSPHSLTNITWPMVTDPMILARMYTAAVNIKSVVVQQIDVNNIVLFQEYGAMDAHNDNVLMKSLFLVTRSQTATGELIVLRGLGQDRLQDRELFLPSPLADAGQVVWHDVFAWYKFDRAGMFGQDCKVSFGGMAPTVGANSQAWSMEVLSLVIRWENAVFGPPQLLPLSPDNDPHAQTSSGRPCAVP